MDHITAFTQYVNNGWHRKMSTHAVFVDFIAAYDTVWRSLLLVIYGISRNIFGWIKSFLSKRQKGLIRFSNCLSKFRIQKQGLAQGSVLGCILFNVMIIEVLASVIWIYTRNTNPPICWCILLWTQYFSKTQNKHGIFFISCGFSWN